MLYLNLHLHISLFGLIKSHRGYIFVMCVFVKRIWEIGKRQIYFQRKSKSFCEIIFLRFHINDKICWLYQVIHKYLWRQDIYILNYFFLYLKFFLLFREKRNRHSTKTRKENFPFFARKYRKTPRTENLYLVFNSTSTGDKNVKKNC